MVPIRGLYEVAIPVRRLPSAEAFYREILGLEVGLRDDRRNWLFLRAGGGAGMVVLQEHDGDVPTTGPISHSWIPGKSLYFRDPDGHDLELFASSDRR